MTIFGWPDQKPLFERANPKSMGDLRFMSTAALERGLDGSEERFASYFFAIYHCSPDEPGGINERREQLRQAFPTKVTPVGQRYVLEGEPAYLAIAAYYQALIICVLPVVRIRCKVVAKNAKSYPEHRERSHRSA